MTDPAHVGFDAPSGRAPALSASPTGEDPRELARRLGQEAKAKMQPEKKGGLASSAPPPRTAPPPPAAAPQPKVRLAPPPSLDDPLDDDFDDPAPVDELPPLGDDEPLPPMRQHKPLSSRPLPPPPKAPGKPMTAAEAMRAAVAAETAAARAPAPMAEPPRKPKKPAAAPPPLLGALSTQATARPTEAHPAAAATDVTRALQALLPRAVIGVPMPVSRPDIFRALWRAHRARAQADGDLALLSTAGLLLDAVERIPAPGFVAVRLDLDDQTWAVWFDATRGLLLGAAQPADVYLAGI